jgi:imidazolonepropionase-like amidohydrolase
LRAGFTTVRDLGNPGGFADVALMRAVDDGWIDGPRIVPVGHALGITGGHCDATGLAPGILEFGPFQGVADGPLEVLKAVRYQAKHGARAIKICATAGVLSFEAGVGAQQYTIEEIRVIVDEAKRHALRVAAHAHGTEGILAAAQAGVASIEHGSILNEKAVSVLKQTGTYLVPNPYIPDWPDRSRYTPETWKKAQQIRPLAEKSLRMAIDAGVKMAFGTDAGVIPHGDNAKQFASFVKRGMPPARAIRLATLDAADLLGRSDLGEIAKGKLADLIAVPGNPLEDVRVLEDVRFVMKGGVVFKNGR